MTVEEDQYRISRESIDMFFSIADLKEQFEIDHQNAMKQILKIRSPKKTDKIETPSKTLESPKKSAKNQIVNFQKS
jgi:hypothetical protein